MIPPIVLSAVLALGQVTGMNTAAGLTAKLNAYLADRSGTVSAAVTDLETGQTYRYHPKVRTATASIVKLDILETLLLKAQDADRALTSGEEALAKNMITLSDNTAATSLFTSVGGAAGLAAANRRLGLTQTTPSSAWGATTTSADDQVRLLTSLVSRTSRLTKTSRSYALGLMGDVTASQAWGVSAAARTGDKVALKNGWLPRPVHGGLWTVNSVGRVTGHGHDYLIAVISERSTSMPEGIATVEHVARAVARGIA
ncbi:beta-lactamase class A [Actinocorallia herbida]|uniref:Beta-lactamase class A n=1 Tax=Actinocorallia herbida TaxID=58109 RepID=A0A3N1D6V1_9ACTN|nr:serine hydrolase [Actinocorallia herbida]ROO88838.1 beta-lactamase class A [Actinocorallia herbida]